MFEETQAVMRDCDVTDVISTSKVFIYTWTINNFPLLHKWKKNVLPSFCSFWDNNGEPKLWRAYLYEISEKEKDNKYLKVKIVFETQNVVIDFDDCILKVHIVKRCNEERELFNGTPEKDEKIILKEVCMGKIDDFLNEANELLPDGTLTFKFKLIFTKCEFRHNNIHTVSCIKKSNIIDFKSALNNEKFSDAKISVNGREFHVHKIILAVQSPVFAAMFDHDMRENIENVVEITDIDHKIMHHLLHFIYTGILMDIEDSAFLDLLRAADKYEINDLKLICELMLIKQLNTNNVINLLIYAEKHTAKVLKESALEYINSHLKEIVTTEEFARQLPNFMHIVLDMFKSLAFHT